MSLQDLGLTAGQERVYRRLTARPDSSLDELSTCGSGRPVDARPAIVALRELGLLVIDPSAPTGHRARRPGPALNDLVEKRTRELSSQLRQIINTQEQIVALDELAAGPSATTPPTSPDEIVILDGLSTVDARVERLAYEARLTLDTVIPGAHPPGRLEQGQSRAMRSLQQGLRVRCVVQPEMLAEEHNLRYIRQLVANGEQVRVTDQPVERFMIVDGARLLVALVPGDKDKGAAMLTQPSVVLGYQQLFDRIWRAAAPFVTADDTPVDASFAWSPADRALLVALTSGATDEVVARTLCVSSRQLRRRVATVMDRLGARNRFEAGVLAERYGLLGSCPDQDEVRAVIG